MTQENLKLYNQVRAVPSEAQKEIRGGRMSGKTDINPMWRIKALTGQFGPCGFGWKYEITKQWLENGENGEVAAFTNINLYVKHNSEWSEPIPGNGGSMFIAMEKDKDSGGKKPFVSDECYKMSLTDAISVSCKALGFGADIYWSADRTKYDKPLQTSPNSPQAGTPPQSNSGTPAGTKPNTGQNNGSEGQNDGPQDKEFAAMVDGVLEQTDLDHCAKCNKELGPAVKKYCQDHPEMFGGKNYCPTCQKPFKQSA